MWLHSVTEMPAEGTSGNPLKAELMPAMALPDQSLNTSKDRGSTMPVLSLMPKPNGLNSCLFQHCP